MKKTSVVIYTLILLLSGCGSNKESIESIIDKQPTTGRDYRKDMRSFVINLSKYAKEINPNFSIIPQNGIELVTDTGEANGNPSTDYLNAIDGNGQEELFYGYNRDNGATPEDVSDFLSSRLNISQQAGNAIFVIDYCSSDDKVIDSHTKNYALNYIPFVATKRDLTVIPETTPTLYQENNSDITTLNDAKNFLFFLNYDKFDTKTEVIDAISNSNYDVVFIDMFFNDGSPFSRLSVEQLKTKANGGKRLVVAYMSIGEAEDYRYYWNNEWNSNKPDWLDDENNNWPGNYKVKYWNPNWQKVIFGNDEAYLDKALKTNYDGVYLDIIDAFEYFENK